MKPSARDLRWAAVPALALAVMLAMLHRHLATAVVMGCLFGTALALPRRATLTAILCCPLAVLVLTISTTAWHWPLGLDQLFAGDMATVVPIGLALGGIVLCALIPYAAARWSGSGLIVAIAAAGCGIGLTLWTADLARSALPRPSHALLISPEAEDQIRAMNYVDWLSSNGQTSNAVHFAYRGHVDIPVCRASHVTGFTAIVPRSSRTAIEHFLDRPLPVELRRWFAKADDGDDTVPCAISIRDRPDETIAIDGRCRPSDAMKRYWLKHPDAGKGFDIDLPAVRLQGPLLVPGKDSILTITAPRNCIAGTFPAARSIDPSGTRETFTLPVGFPRDGFSVMDAERSTLSPWNVHIEWLRPIPAIVSGAGALLHALDRPSALFLLFVIVTLASWPLIRMMLGRLGTTGGIAMLATRIRAWRAGCSTRWKKVIEWRNAHRRFLLIARIILLALLGLLILIPLLFASIVVMFDPTLTMAVGMIGAAFCLIEIIALLVRRHMRAMRASNAAEGAGAAAPRRPPQSR